jgi:hypothetical protein
MDDRQESAGRAVIAPSPDGGSFTPTRIAPRDLDDGEIF